MYVHSNMHGNLMVTKTYCITAEDASTLSNNSEAQR